MNLFYHQAAEDWTQALPVGNGQLGAMVYGRPCREVIQLNEETVWDGGPMERDNPDCRKHLQTLRRYILEGNIKEAEDLASKAVTGLPEGQRHYQSLGELQLAFRHGETVSRYVRGLELDSACAYVCYEADGVLLRRTVFANHPHNVLVVQVRAEREGAVDVDVRYDRKRYLNRVRAKGNTILGLGGGGIGFAVAVRAACGGGTVTAVGESLCVRGAHTLTLYLSCRTSFREQDPAAAALALVDAAEQTGYEALMQEHQSDYKQYFDRVSLHLEEDGANGALPADVRLRRVRAGARDLGLETLLFHYGRYLLISSSRPGTLPANLQGIWNQEMLPPWDSKYTININTEMNYWAAEACHLPELHQPLFGHLKQMAKRGAKTARDMYGCRGWVAHHNTDLWADTSPQDRNLKATYWTMGGAWLSLDIWQHYLYSGDKMFLREYYPILRGAAEFFVDFLIEDDAGRLVTCPSSSPENRYITQAGEPGSLCAASAMDCQILRELFAACSGAAEILGIDGAFAQTLRGMSKRLPETKIGKHGQIQEWQEDYEEAEPGHRHLSHLFGLFPGREFSPRRAPEWAEAAKISLQRRLAAGSGHTGWSRAWVINLWARLLDGNRAHDHIQKLMECSTQVNLMNTHPPFQIDGNFGLVSGMCELLLQWEDGVVYLLPALPDCWKAGEARGLCAPGGLTVDMRWQQGKLCGVRLCAAWEGERRIALPRGAALKHGIGVEARDGIYEVSMKQHQWMEWAVG